MKKRNIKDVVVIGGGTAGWLTALYVKTLMPNKDVTVVESDAIGILGAGEGTTSDLIRLLDALEIPVSRLIKETSCTIKNGIRFINWNGGGDEDYFYHGFDNYGNLSTDHYKLDPLVAAAPPAYFSAIDAGESFSAGDFTSKLAEDGRVPFFHNQNEVTFGADPITGYTSVGAWAVHFDASRLALFLKEIALERGISHVEALVVDYTQGADGDVKSISIENGPPIKTDFIFDCSGFKSFFNKKFETEWVSYKEHLPTDSAVPFFIDIPDTEEIPPYTQAIAMNYGWMWKTPLQHRYGCGYVFDSRYINEEEAVAEIEEYLGFEPFYPRKDKGAFKFEAGYYDEPWKHNVISVGLASGFIEPLEATSMWVTVSALGRVLGNPEVLYAKDARVAEEFNSWFRGMNSEILDFIYYHYYTKRTDTEFWAQFTKEKAPEGLKKLLNLYELRMPNSDDFVTSIWPLNSWYKVGLAHGNEDLIARIKDANRYSIVREYLANNYEKFKELQAAVLPTFATHRSFLETLSGSKLNEKPQR